LNESYVKRELESLLTLLFMLKEFDTLHKVIIFFINICYIQLIYYKS